MDGDHAVDSAAVPDQACVLVSRGLFFAAVLLGFLLLGMASASAEEDGQRETPVVQGSSETGNHTPQNQPPNESDDAQPVTSTEPGTTPQGQGDRQTESPDEEVLESPPVSESVPVEPTAPPPPESEPPTESDPVEPTAPAPPQQGVEPTAPAPPAEGSPSAGDDGESGSTEGESATPAPASDALDETSENVNELVLDKPEKLVRAADKTVRNTTEALTSQDPADRSLRNLTRTATDPLLREVGATVDDVVELTRREVGVVRRTVSGVDRKLKGLGDDLSDDLGDVAGQKPEQQPVPDVGGLDPGAASSQRVPLQAPDGADVPAKRSVSPQVSRSNKHLEPAPYAAEAASTAKHSLAAQAAAPDEPLEISPVVGGAATSSDSTGSGAGSSAAACVIESFVMRLGGGHQVVAAPAVVAPRMLSLQPGFAPD